MVTPIVRRFGACAVVLLSSLLPAGPASGFELHTGGASYSWQRLSRFVMPADTVRFEVRDLGVACGWAVSAGELVDAGDNCVDWIAPAEPGLYNMAVSGAEEAKEVNLFVMVPYDSLRDGELRGFRVGRYPETNPFPSFIRPRGFIEVTPENKDTPVSPRHMLEEFLPHQPGDFPKYVVLREELLRKLELLADLIVAKGYECGKLTIMSGYRTPAYQSRRGAGKNSAHIYGGAADIFLDRNRSGSMDDLDGDGSSNSADAKVMAAWVEELEKEHPDLVGGCGWYRRTRSRGPFIHIDVRGERIRWHQ